MRGFEDSFGPVAGFESEVPAAPVSVTAPDPMPDGILHGTTGTEDLLPEGSTSQPSDASQRPPLQGPDQQQATNVTPASDKAETVRYRANARVV